MTAPEFRLNGLIAAAFTAFDAGGALSLAPIEAYADFLARNGATGVFVCGTTGEGVSMTTAERMENLARWRDVARGALKIVAHVGHNSLPDAQALAAHAARARVDAIGTVAPSVLRPAALDDLVDWCAAVAAEAPETPYFYYHIPVLTGVRHDMVRFCERAATRSCLPDSRPARTAQSAAPSTTARRPPRASSPRSSAATCRRRCAR